MYFKHFNLDPNRNSNPNLVVCIENLLGCWPCELLDTQKQTNNNETKSKDNEEMNTRNK